MNSRSVLIGGGGAAAGLLVTVLLVLNLYVWPRAALRTQVENTTSANERFRSWIAERGRVKDGLKRIAATTLAARDDKATERFRSALGDLGGACGLAVSSVNSFEPEAVMSPAGAKVKGTVATELKKQIDFKIIRGELVGSGTLDQTLRMIAAARIQPWLHRIESFSLKPEDKGHERFTLRLGVATILMTDLAPKDLGDPRIVPLDPEAPTQWASIAEKNMFREPPPIRVAKADPPAPPQPPPGPPPIAWGEWKLTGVIETRRRVEAILVNTKSGGSAVLSVGSPVLGATFVGGNRDVAVFEIDGKKYEVLIGQTLEQRSLSSR